MAILLAKSSLGPSLPVDGLDESMLAAVPLLGAVPTPEILVEDVAKELTLDPA